MAVAVVIATAMLLAVLATKTDTLRQDWRRLAGDPGQACFDHDMASHRIHASAVFDSTSVNALDENEVMVTYRASIGDAAPVGAEVVCALRDGKFSAEDTARRREDALVARRIGVLMAEFNCLDRKKVLLRAGKVDDANRVRCSK
jgi:hypothetical protein